MAFEYIDQLSERLQKLSNGELDALASMRTPASVPAPAKVTEVKTVPGITPQETSVVEAPARVRPIEMPDDYKFELRQTQPYMENVNRAIEGREIDKGSLAKNAQQSYEDQKRAEISYMQALEDMKKSREPYKTPDWLSQKINEAKSSSESLEKAPERNLMSEAILAFAPGLAAAITGSESMALAAPKAQEQGRNLYEVYRKEELDQIEKRNKAVKDKYENLAKLDKAYADRWLGEQKLAADQAKAVIEGLKLPIQVSQKDALQMTELASGIGKENTANIMKGAEKIADLETLPMKEREKAKRANIIASGQNLKDATSLRKEYNDDPIIKNFKSIQEANAKIQSSSDNPIGHLNAITGYAKIIDPGNAVKEGEFKNVEQARAFFTRASENGIMVPSFVMSAINQLRGKGKLLPQQLAELKREARVLYNAQQWLAAQKEREYIGFSAQYGVDPSLIVPKKSTPTKVEVPTPQDQAAIDWLKKNPKDPNAKAVKKKLKAKGLL